MKIDPETCISCEACVPYCPMYAISMKDDIAVVDQDECVDCAACLKANICPVDCIISEPAPWPRAVRAHFSDPLAEHKVTGIAGRGTEEVKTNEVTGRLQKGWLALAVELGRPVIGARFRDVEKLAQTLAKFEVHFEPKNPVTALMVDTATGKINEDILNEKVLSAIIECVFPAEKAPSILKALKEATKEIDSVCSVVMADLVGPDEKVPLEKTLDELGFSYSINGKNNTGLGRPKYEGGK